MPLCIDPYSIVIGKQTYIQFLQCDCLVYLGLYRSHDLVNTTPLIFIFRPASNHTKTFQDVDYVVDPPSLNTKLFGAAVKK